MKAYFVTGTDTGVGKTTVSVALLAAATQRGLATGAMKPAESGCERSHDGTLIPRDAESLRAACSLGQSREDVCPYRFTDPVAPAVAAAREGRSIDIAVIADRFSQLQQRAPDLVLVEGAGGLLVPYAEDLCAADLARVLDVPVLIVSRPELGTINHTLLTVEAARRRGLYVVGVVFSCSHSKTDPALQTSNAEEIERLGQVRVLGALPFAPAGRSHESTVQANAILDVLLGSP